MRWLGRKRHNRPISLRGSLLLLVAVCVLPALALSGYNAFERYRLIQLQIYAQTQRLAEVLVADVDRELAGVESGLKVLATSDALRNGELAQFHRVAKEAVKSQIVYNYVLTSSAGAQLVNTLVPPGEPLPKAGTPPQLAAVFGQANTVLTDYFIGPVTGKPAIAMGVPVRNAAGQVAYSLNVGMAPDKLGEILKRRPVANGWLVALLDSSGTMVGRSRDAKQYVGTKIVPELFANILANRNGSMEAVTKDGETLVTAYASSARWGWSVAVGAPKAAMEARLHSAFLALALTTGAIVLIAGWIALSIVRNLTHSVDALYKAALQINNGKPVKLPRLRLAEAEAIGHAIVQASQLSSEVHFKAYHDVLTGLANRALFHEFLDNSLARARRSGKAFSLLLIDLDHFKKVNDDEGHALGDALLKDVARRIGAEIRAEDLAARLGGDEFGVLLVDSDRSAASDVASRIVKNLGNPSEVCKTRTSASVGVVSWRADIPDGAAMVKLADEALYRVKQQGRNAYLEAV